LPHPCLVQSVKQGFCFSWDSAWLLQFTQEENSQKPEPQLKQTRSSTKETGHLLQCLRDPYCISSKLDFHIQPRHTPRKRIHYKPEPKLSTLAACQAGVLL